MHSVRAIEFDTAPVFLGLTLRQYAISKLDDLFWVKYLAGLYSLLQTNYQPLPLDDSYQLRRESILQRISNLDISSKTHSLSQLALINRIKKDIGIKLPNGQSVADYAQERQEVTDSQLIEAITKFKQFSRNIEQYLPTRYCADYDCPICYGSFTLGDQSSLACHHCSLGLLHTECLAKWRYHKINRQLFASIPCIHCNRTYNDEDPVYIGEKLSLRTQQIAQ